MAGVRLELFGPDDLPLVQRLMGDPAMTEHLGGPESPEKLVERHERYMRHSGKHGAGQMFKIVDAETAAAMGSVGYWERDWRGGKVWETGWSVVPEFQGHGIATEGTVQVIERARAEGTHRFLHAFPEPDNGPSNAICRKLGFTLLGEVEIEFPLGHFAPSNDWRLDLRA